MALSIKKGAQVAPPPSLSPSTPLLRLPPPGLQVRDMRHHSFVGRQLQRTQVVYIRAARRGACDYVDDGRCVCEGGGGEGVSCSVPRWLLVGWQLAVGRFVRFVRPS